MRAAARRRRTAAALLAATLLGLPACTVGTERQGGPTATASTSPGRPAVQVARVAAPDAPTTVLPAATDEQAALEVTRTVFAEAPVVVLADVADAAGQAAAVADSARLAAPVLLTGPTVAPADLRGELDRLGTRWVVVEGAAAAPLPEGTVALPAAATTPTPTPSATRAPSATREPSATRTSSAASKPPSARPAPSAGAVLPPTEHPEPVAGTVALTGVGPAPAAALASIAVAGIPVVDVPGGDPRLSSATVQAIAQAAPAHVVALGSGFGDPARLADRVATAATGVEAPGGGQLVFPPGPPGKRYVALYGTPGTRALGVLGEQDVPATVVRAQQQADAYRPLTGDTVVPAVEIIATIASAGPGPDGNYSDERPVDALRPLVDAAGAAGLAVVLDLQPGRTDFLTQAQQYADLLRLPHVGLALDPEWRLAPDQVHLRQIGSVGVDEINAVSAWLADLTRSQHLPQKMLVVHQFSLRMVQGRERLDTSHDELATVIHVDGQGTQPAKAGTWATLLAGAPPVHWGWKNFVDEDEPMLDPAQTYGVRPTPDLVTYQ